MNPRDSEPSRPTVTLPTKIREECVGHQHYGVGWSSTIEYGDGSSVKILRFADHEMTRALLVQVNVTEDDSTEPTGIQEVCFHSLGPGASITVDHGPSSCSREGLNAGAGNSAHWLDVLATMVLTAKEAAEIIGCDQTSVCYLANRGKLKAVRRGTQWFFDADDVAAYRRRRPNESK